MTGIYKITNPKGKVYIGQSIDIEKRFNTYKKLNCKNQTLLYRSLFKYGFENHLFELIEETELNLLNNRERYWQDYFNVLEKGLNCSLTKSKDKSGKQSEFTKKRISKSQIGKSSFSDNRNSKTVLNLENGIYYFSAKEVSVIYGINYSTLKNKLNGCKVNNTNFIYV